MSFQTYTGTEYLMADIACKADKKLEKEDYPVRIAAFENMDLTDKNLFKRASDPIGLRASSLAMEATKKGEATGYMISLDAASSGLQLLSLLVSCPTSFKLCGGDDTIMDAYAAIYQEMGVGKHLTRKQVKGAIMTSLYGSEKGPKDVFGSDIDLFYDTMEEMAPGAWDLNIGLQELWEEVQGNTYDWELPDGFYACIETHDTDKVTVDVLGEKHEIVVKLENERPEFHKGLGPNLIHSVDGMIVREMFRRCMFDPMRTSAVAAMVMDDRNHEVRDNNYTTMVKKLWANYKRTGFLSVRILDYIQYDNIALVDKLVIAEMIRNLPDEPFEMVAVHDCFRAHPNYGNDLRRQYNIILADINDSHSLLSDLATQIAGKKINAKKVGKIKREDILNANHLIT